jgi:ATP-dependent helicase HrpA
VWDREAFETLSGRIAASSADRLVAVASNALEILDELREIRRTLADGWVEPYEAATTDIEEQIGRLVYPGFLTSVGADRLPDILRYLRAISRRLETLPDRVERDRELMERIRDLEAERDGLSDAVPDSTELIEIAWMLQELRVSAFAQTIGTKGKVSEKRIIEALERAVAP